MKAYLVLFLLILIVCFSGIYFIKKSSSETKTEVVVNVQGLRLLKCQEIAVAKGVCNVKAKISQNKSLLGYRLPDFVPTSKSASYEGPVTVKFGYDSTMLLFPEGTSLETDENTLGTRTYIISIPEFPKPVVLSDPSRDGYTKESTSYFTGDIPATVFDKYVDSLVVVAGNRTITEHADYFRDAYADMVMGVVKALMGSNNFIIRIGDKSYDGDNPMNNPEQKFVEGIEDDNEL